MRLSLVNFLVLGVFTTSLSQVVSKDDQPFGVEGRYTFETEKPYKLLELDEETEEPIVRKKKKPRKKVYYGIKTKKGFTRKGSGQRARRLCFSL